MTKAELDVLKRIHGSCVLRIDWPMKGDLTYWTHKNKPGAREKRHATVEKLRDDKLIWYGSGMGHFGYVLTRDGLNALKAVS